MNTLDETHDPLRRSWLPDAQAPGGDFPIQNLPLCIFEHEGRPTPGIGLGRHILHLRALLAAVPLPEPARHALALLADSEHLNPLMQAGPQHARALRQAVSALMSEAHGPASVRAAAEHFLVPMAGARYRVPARIEGYTDFLCSRHHTERHGRLKGLAQPLPPAFVSLPVAYNGRPSSIRVSGTPVQRPWGQSRSAEGEVRFGPSQALDFELELGCYIGRGNALGAPIPLAAAASHLFGFCLLNDWSAKDIQWWEQVLGPFLGKSFLTSVSPWVVTAEALAPFRCAVAGREPTDPPLLPYLFDETDARQGGLDVRVEAHLLTADDVAAARPGARLTASHARASLWSFAQMVAHHTSNGCNLQPGDLIGSGTLSGATAAEMACLTEMTEAGRRALPLLHGQERRWLEDGDTVVLRARAERPGFVGIGFGECRGTVTAASADYPAA